MGSGVGQEIVANAGFRRQQSSLFGDGFSFSGFERNALRINRGGTDYVDISGVSGMDDVGDGRGIVYADFDNDGDSDVFVTNTQGRTHLLYRNEVGQDAGHLRIQLEGKASGPDAYGEVVRVSTPAGTLTKINSGGSGFLAQHDPRLLFGLADEPQTGTVEVRWPSGKRASVPSLPARSSWLWVEGNDAPTPIVERAAKLPAPEIGSRPPTLLLAPGDTLPALPLRDLAGLSATLRGVVGTSGHRTLVNLWTTWCRVCALEMPELGALHEEFKADGFKVVGVCLDGDADGIRRIARSRNATYPQYLAGPDATSSLFQGSDALVPISILVEGDGRVRAIHAGWNASIAEETRAFARGNVDR